MSLVKARVSTRFSRIGAVVGALALLASNPALALTSDTVALSGNVASTLAVTVTDAAGALTLNMAAAAQIVKVADVDATTNNSTGLTINVTSGNITNPDGINIAYQVHTVTDAALAPIAGAFVVASGAAYNDASNAAGAYARDLYILYTPGSPQDPGTYTGTITVTVSDNP